MRRYCVYRTFGGQKAFQLFNDWTVESVNQKIAQLENCQPGSVNWAPIRAANKGEALDKASVQFWPPSVMRMLHSNARTLELFDKVKPDDGECLFLAFGRTLKHRAREKVAQHIRKIPGLRS